MFQETPRAGLLLVVVMTAYVLCLFVETAQVTGKIQAILFTRNIERAKSVKSPPELTAKNAERTKNVLALMFLVVFGAGKRSFGLGLRYGKWRNAFIGSIRSTNLRNAQKFRFTAFFLSS